MENSARSAWKLTCPERPYGRGPGITRGREKEFLHESKRNRDGGMGKFGIRVGANQSSGSGYETAGDATAAISDHTSDADVAANADYTTDADRHDSADGDSGECFQLQLRRDHQFIALA